MKPFWSTFFSCLLAIAVSSVVSFFLSLFIYIGILMAIMAGSGSTTEVLHSKTTLVIDLSTPIVDRVSDDPMSYLDFKSMSINEPMSILGLRATLKQAAIDPKIKGIMLKIPMNIPSSLSMLYELRALLADFRASAPEKFVTSYGDVYSQGALYLSSVCSDVFMNPYGSAPLSGLAATPMFFKGTLDKLGVEPQIIRYGKFKGAVEPYTLSGLSAENRAQYQSLIGSQWSYLLWEIASGRGLGTRELNHAASNLSIVDAQQSLDAGLVDSLMYVDELHKWLEEKVDDDEPNYISYSGYKALAVDAKKMSHDFSDNQIEVITATGAIVDEAGGRGPEIVGRNLAAQIRKARKDDDVKAVVLRVNSPGGSVIASEVIAREVELTAAEKPIVVSMGSVAASGGYWISAPATAIVSGPLTVTGSIGVFAMMFDAHKGLKEHLGVTIDPVVTNPSADMGSIARGLSPLERRVMQNTVNTIYNKFTANVAKGRDMPQTKVDEIGQGRVWTGAQARDLGLVDTLGTIGTAIELAARKADIEDDYMLVQRKQKGGLFTKLFSGTMNAAIASVSSFFGYGQLAAVQEVQQKIEQEHGKVQARMPLDLQITH